MSDPLSRLITRAAYGATQLPRVAWYLGHGRFPKPFKNELVQLYSTEEVVTRLLAAAPGAADLLAELEADVPESELLLEGMPISLYGGG